MREETNAEFASTQSLVDTKTEATTHLERQGKGDTQEFKISTEFEKQVAHFRYGDGGANITFAELLDEDLLPINEVRFNQAVFVRIYFETSTDIERFL